MAQRTAKYVFIVHLQNFFGLGRNRWVLSATSFWKTQDWLIRKVSPQKEYYFLHPTFQMTWTMSRAVFTVSITRPMRPVPLDDSESPSS